MKLVVLSQCRENVFWNRIKTAGSQDAGEHDTQNLVGCFGC